jgi:hypothetical protein
MTNELLVVLQQHVGGCREEMADGGKCWRPAEYVLWGKMIESAGLGPRCYDHAVAHVGHHALARRSGYALIHLGELAEDIIEQAVERMRTGG